jgi:hypothetical protein
MVSQPRAEYGFAPVSTAAPSNPRAHARKKGWHRAGPSPRSGLKILLNFSILSAPLRCAPSSRLRGTGAGDRDGRQLMQSRSPLGCTGRCPAATPRASAGPRRPVVAARGERIFTWGQACPGIPAARLSCTAGLSGAHRLRPKDGAQQRLMRSSERRARMRPAAMPACRAGGRWTSRPCTCQAAVPASGA